MGNELSTTRVKRGLTSTELRDHCKDTQCQGAEGGPEQQAKKFSVPSMLLPIHSYKIPCPSMQPGAT